MRTLVYTVAMIAVLAGCDAATTPAPAPEATQVSEAPAISQPDAANVEAFNAAIKTEPKVIDFVYDPAAVFQWTIGVKDDGSPRHGYAEYLCSRLSEFDLSRDGMKIRIVDFGKFMEPDGNGRDASLGSVDCQTSEHMMP